MNIFQAICAIQKEIDFIGRNKKNSGQGFMFRGIDDVYNSLHGLFSKHEVFCMPEVLESFSEDRTAKSGGTNIFRILKIKYTFYAADGSSVSCIVQGEGLDTSDKGSNKAMAVGHKYALLQMFTIPTLDMTDPDSITPEQSVPEKEDKRDEQQKPTYTQKPKSSASDIYEEPKKQEQEQPKQEDEKPKQEPEKVVDETPNKRKMHNWLKHICDLNDDKIKIVIRKYFEKDVITDEEAKEFMLKVFAKTITVEEIHCGF